MVDSKLPTRVIDVGNATTEPFLKITRGETGRYLALSHRWGPLESQQHMLMTKTKTIDKLCRKIPLYSFPTTFRHAIEVTRSLGVQYIWIDSLCIVQDSMQDWEVEATRMGDIFENAYATLFAERAENCADGLFQTSEDRYSLTRWIREIDYCDPQTHEKHQILVSWPSYYPHSLQEAFCMVEKPVSYLQNRGWVMQEEILSRRKVCFSAAELHWQCKSMSQCECDLRSTVDPNFIRNLLWTPRGDGSVTRGLSASDRSARKATGLNKAWKSLIELYTRREFTNERDKLPALAGIASKFGREPHDYWAGIWRQDAHDQLLWHGLNLTNAPCRRHKPYYAPSWSWAALQGGIIFCAFNDRHKKTKRIWDIKDGSCQPSGENPMGLVSTGMLRIQSKAAPVLVTECEGRAPDVERSEGFSVFKQYGVHEQTRNGKTYHLMLRAETEAGKETCDTVVFLDTSDDWELFADKAAQLFYYLIAEAGTVKGDAVITEDISRTMGLLIRESPVKEGHWERICLLAPQGWWRDWSGIAEDKEFILI
ncbi:hypothetical protein BP5796_12074 [Coleophoma crateriformis]|uniref:Heterokaryon incompatibility domain-containing protein n=1 Tax=Coleophoma crateriformis TaxID=565419 RepID=A0A3D8QBX7_9HELO|nr:hypothetical protein BP5796_12074 [Coleophoma crateriformis]